MKLDKGNDFKKNLIRKVSNKLSFSQTNTVVCMFDRQFTYYVLLFNIDFQTYNNIGLFGTMCEV